MKLKLIIATLCLLVLGITAFSAENYYAASRQVALQENHHQSLSTIIESAERIDSLLKERSQAVSRLAQMDQLIDALRPGNPATINNVTQVLVNFQSGYSESVYYLLNRQGETLASSNHSEPDSFVGKNYSFRPYFQEALLGRASTFAATGITSGKKGFYLGHPVREPANGMVIGVVASKLPLETIRQEIIPGHFRGIIALTSPDDLLFLSNPPGLENHFLWHLPSPARITALERSRQFGPGPWPWTGFKKINLTQARGPDGQSYTVHQHPITAIPGWQLTYLHDDQGFAAQLSSRLRREIGLFLFSLLLIVCLSVFLLYRLAEREILAGKGQEDRLRSNQQLLQKQVASHTQVLLREIEKNQGAAAELEHSHKTKELLNRILSLALENNSLQGFLDDFVQQAANYSDLGLLPKGALFLIDEDDPECLRLKAQYGLNQSLLSSCQRVKFGHCICGRAAQDGKVLFVDRVDARHDTTYEGMIPHGHYCVPILAPDRVLLGLYNVYTRPEVAHDQRVEDFLVSVSTVLSGIIRFKQTTEQIAESEEKHRAIADTAQEAIISIDHEGRTTFWNPAAARIFGYSAEEVLGKDLHQLLTPARFLAEARRGLAHFAENGQGPLIGQSVEISGRRKDGSEVDLELSISPLHQHSRWSAVGIMRDISARKTSEKEKAQLQAQLRQAQKMEAIGTLAGGIAHDFNNILSSILGYAELVKEELPREQPETIDDIDQVIKAGNRAKELVRQILTFSRQTEEEFVPVQISLIVKEALKLLRSSLPSAIEIRQVISDSALTVFADPSQIHQVLMNLCTNSFKAMRDKGGLLEVRLESFTPDQPFNEAHPDLRGDRYVIMVVRDTGVGMDSSIIPRIFEPYFSTNKKEDGTGLGLAVVHGIVSRLGGAIEVESTVGLGSTFKVYLPVVVKTELPAELPDTDFLPPGTERILLVDDELPLLELGSRMLSGLGYQVTCRTSSIEALELFRHQQEKFDLVITDQNMPNMTGTRMAEEMTVIRADIPIILCTGYSELNIGQHSRGRCIREIVMKPIARSQLAGIVRQVLDGSPTSPCQDH